MDEAEPAARGERAFDWQPASRRLDRSAEEEEGVQEEKGDQRPAGLQPLGATAPKFIGGSEEIERNHGQVERHLG